MIKKLLILSTVFCCLNIKAGYESEEFSYPSCSSSSSSSSSDLSYSSCSSSDEFSEEFSYPSCSSSSSSSEIPQTPPQSYRQPKQPPKRKRIKINPDEEENQHTHGSEYYKALGSDLAYSTSGNHYERTTQYKVFSFLITKKGREYIERVIADETIKNGSTPTKEQCLEKGIRCFFACDDKNPNPNKRFKGGALLAQGFSEYPYKPSQEDLGDAIKRRQGKTEDRKWLNRRIK